MALDKSNIKVLNYNRNFVSVVCRDRAGGIGKSEDGIEPNFDFFTMQEIEQINAKSPVVFRTGLLEFEDEYKAEIYAALHIPDWEERCIFERDIDDMILNPSLEKSKKIVAIKDPLTIERIRGHMFDLIQSGAPVGVNIQRMIERRYYEISNGILNTAIEIEPAKATVSTDGTAVDELKAQLAAQQEVLNKLINQQTPVAAVNVEGNLGEAVSESVESEVVESVAPVEEAPVHAVTSSTKVQATAKTATKTTTKTPKKPVGRPAKK